MAEFLVEFEWFKDPSGYELLEAVAPRPWVPKPVKTIVGEMMMMEPGLLTQDSGQPQKIKRKGGELKRYSPLDKYNSLCLTFCQYVQDAKSLFEFVNEFGPLTQYGLEQEYGEEVAPILVHADSMRSRSTKTALFDAGGLYLQSPRLALIPDEKNKTFRLQISPKNLLDALWLQFAQLCQENIAFRTCEYCGDLFSAGPGTGRRYDAKFCKPPHQVAFHSRRRSKTARDMP